MNSVQVKTTFKKVFKQNPQLYRSPARINIIGGHTDYTGGYALPMAIDKTLYFAIAPYTHRIELHALNFDECAVIPIDLERKPEAFWAQYIFACLKELHERGLELKGMQCSFGGDIPLGAGISSSAALTCGFIYALNDLFGYKLSLLDIAKIAQAAEHRVGTKCGIMDQYAILFSQEHKVIQLDCLNLSHEYAPIDLGDYTFVLFNSNVPRSLAESAYNERFENCQFVLKTIQEKEPVVKSLRDVDEALLEKHKGLLSPAQFVQVRYVLRENERVLQSAKALAKGDIRSLGQYLFQTHKGLKNEYEVSCKELDFLVSAMQECPEAIGARLVGGGYGGCTLNIIKKDAVDRIFSELKANYFTHFNIELDMYIVSSSQGVSKL